MNGSSLQMDEARADLYEIIRRDGPFEPKARDVLELGRQVLGAENGHLTRIDRDTDHWEVLVSTDGDDGQFPDGLELDLGTTYCRRVLSEGNQIALHDAPEEGWADDPAFEAHGLHCYHGTDLVVDGESYGTVCFVSNDPRRDAFGESETLFAELIARLLERELERERHETQLSRQANLATVLNRVLRHNIRNDVSILRGYTQQMADELGGTSYGDQALETLDKLIELSQKARELDRIVGADDEYEPVQVGTLVTSVAESVSERFPAARISVTAESPVVASVLPSFERAIEELLENAVVHSGDSSTPSVSVTVEPVPDAVEIRIADHGPGLATHEAEVLQSGEETPLMHGSGLGLWLVHWIVTSHGGSVEPIVTEDGTTMTVTVPRLGATDIQQELSRLVRARDRYQAAFDGAGEGMVILDDDGRIVDANPEASTIYGLDHRELLGRSIREFMPSGFDFEEEWDTFLEHGREAGTMVTSGADGVDRPIEYSASADIIPGQHLVVGRDITDRVQREAELESRTNAMDEAPIGISITDPTREDNPIVYVNDHFQSLTGYDEAEVLGRNCRFLQGAETDPVVVARIREAIENGEPVSEVIKNYRKDGTAFWNDLEIAPVEDDDGDLVNFVGFQQDVTERIQREHELRETTDRLETVFEVSPHPIITVDTEGNVQGWNTAAADRFGFTAAEIEGKPLASFVVADDDQRADFAELLERALAGETVTDVEVERETADGETILLSLSAAPLRDASGTITGVMAIATDITAHVPQTPSD